MGKAIVIDGLEVTNPLTTVHFATTESILSEYYAANSSISASEKDALEDLVQHLLDNELWSKVKYFYPMLGDNVSDQILDAVNPSTEDIISDFGTTGLSVSGRILQATAGREASTKVLPRNSRSRSLTVNNISYIASLSYQDTTKPPQNCKVLHLQGVNTSNEAGLTGMTYSGKAYPSIFYTGGSVPTSGAALYENNYNERILYGGFGSTRAVMYKDNTLYVEVTSLSVPSTTMNRSYGVLTNGRSDNLPVNYNGLFITELLTDAEWLEIYPYFLQYLKAVGKHS